MGDGVQVYFRENLAMLAVPKTGSTAYEMALRGRADIIFAKRRKHMSATKFHNQVGPFLDFCYDLRPERLAVIRHPVDQMRSWYRYRSRDEVADRAVSTRSMSFDDFVAESMADKPIESAQVGNQINLLSLPDGSLGVHYLFAYENQELLIGWLEDRFASPIKLNQKNVSPQIPAELGDATLSAFKQHRADEFELYDRVQASQGCLISQISSD